MNIYQFSVGYLCARVLTLCSVAPVCSRISVYAEVEIATKYYIARLLWLLVYAFVGYATSIGLRVLETKGNAI